jgi:hypothetical protein
VEWTPGCGEGPCYIKIGDSTHSCCLCDAISDLEAENLITDVVANMMSKKVRRYGDSYRTTDPNSCLLWPMSPEGAARRAEFCKIILRELQC